MGVTGMSTAVNERRREMVRLVATGVFALALTSCISRKASFLSTDITGVPWGHDFRLIDHTGQVRTLSDFRGKAVMLFFGYTHCPDMCPITLANMAEVVNRLGKDGKRVQGLFVTLDPARDTRRVLAQYVTAFHPTFVGLSGTEAEIEQAAREFKLFFKRQPADASGFYTVDHLSAVFAFDREGRLRLYMRADSDPASMAHDMRILLHE